MFSSLLTVWAKEFPFRPFGSSSFSFFFSVIGHILSRSRAPVRSLARLVMKGLPAPDGGNRGSDSATSANDRVMAPEPIGSHPIHVPVGVSDLQKGNAYDQHSSRRCVVKTCFENSSSSSSGLSRFRANRSHGVLPVMSFSGRIRGEERRDYLKPFLSSSGVNFFHRPIQGKVLLYLLKWEEVGNPRCKAECQGGGSSSPTQRREVVYLLASKARRLEVLRFWQLNRAWTKSFILRRMLAEERNRRASAACVRSEAMKA
ncbi:peptidyl-tRNA hydrolase [Striga asiatica]|uniref:Peptidyl-tRNA hydrolase n=1 Tax=Striga asiatica TaxID=4170 RepID=A0A5A7QKE1_STRAF|nr:peptidyl-tRNA hydrolase [Striga asiatica]